MKWRRPAVAPVAGDASLDEIGRMLEAAVLAAPPSPRADVIRARLVAAAALADGGRSSGVTMPILRPLALVAVLLLIVALAIAAPAVGSFIDGLTDDGVTPPPPPPMPSPSVQDADDRTDAVRALGQVDRGAKAIVPRVPAAQSGAPAGPEGATPSPAADSASPVPSPAAIDVGLPIGPPLPIPWPVDSGPFVSPVLTSPTPSPNPVGTPPP
ncbi:MAG: hypothetical protein ACRDFY_01710 [Candidatus Limnocylindria bacterium]